MNETTMHDAKLEREVKKMLLGEEDKIQWGELLRTFCQLQKGRMEIALESLTKRQLDLLIDSAQTVKEDVQTSTLEAAKTELLRLGLTPEEFIHFLNGTTPDEKGEAKKVPVTTRSYKSKYGKSMSDIVAEIIETGELSLPTSANELLNVVLSDLPQYKDITKNAWYSAAYDYNKKHGVSLTK